MRRRLLVSIALSLLVAAPASARRAGGKHAAAPGKAAKKGKAGKGAPAAAVDRAHIPGGGPPPRLNMPAPERFVLSSGAKVLVVERHTLPMAAVAVIWPTGATFDPADKAGLSGLTADLLDEGTAKHGALALAGELESIGSTIASGGGWDSTGVSLTTLTRNLDRSLALLAEVVVTPAFEGAELERKRVERITSIAQRRDHAAALASDVASAVLFGEKHPFGHPMFGTEQGLSKVDRADVTAFFEEHLGPASATILVVGDVEGKSIKQKLETAFAGWKRAQTAAATAAKAEVPAPPPARWALVDKPDAPQSEIRIGQPGPARLDPDYFPLLVMNGILGGDFSSRLNLNLREAHGYTYGARSDFAFRRDGGPFAIGTAAKTQVTGAALAEAFKEIDAIRAAAPKPEELRLSKDMLERALARRFETLADVAAELGQIVIEGLPVDFLSTFADKVEKVDGAAVLRAAQEHLSPERMSVIVVGDATAVWPQVWKLGPFRQTDATGKPLHPDQDVAPPTMPITAPAPAPAKQPVP